MPTQLPTTGAPDLGSTAPAQSGRLLSDIVNAWTFVFGLMGRQSFRPRAN